MKTNKNQWFKFYAEDWLSSAPIALLTPTQRGYFVQIMARMWASGECVLPDDYSQLSRMAGADEFRLAALDAGLTPEQTAALGSFQPVYDLLVIAADAPGFVTHPKLWQVWVEAQQQTDAWRKRTAAATAAATAARVRHRNGVRNGTVTDTGEHRNAVRNGPIKRQETKRQETRDKETGELDLDIDHKCLSSLEVPPTSAPCATSAPDPAEVEYRSKAILTHLPKPTPSELTFILRAAEVSVGVLSHNWLMDALEATRRAQGVKRPYAYFRKCLYEGHPQAQELLEKHSHVTPP